MKKILALSLALCLCLGLGVTALAADIPEGWTPADGARTGEQLLISPAPKTVDAPIPAQYSATVTVDGVELDTTGIPGAPAGYIPMRAVTEAAEGTASYYSEDNQALFFLDNSRFIVDFATMTLQVEFEDVEAKPYLDPAGYTFLPVSILNGQGSIVVNVNPELDVERYDIVTSLSDPMVKLVKNIEETCEMAGIGPIMDDFLTMLEFDMDNYVHLVAYAPMMNIKSNAVFIAEVAEGKMDAAKKDFNAFQEQQMSSFEHYLGDQYELAKNGQIVESPDGAHLMLVISENNDKAIELFNAAYPAAE